MLEIIFRVAFLLIVMLGLIVLVSLIVAGHLSRLQKHYPSVEYLQALIAADRQADEDPESMT